PYEYDYPDWEKDPVRSYSQYLLGKDTGGNTIDKLDLLGESIKASGAKGVLLYGYVGCTFSGIDRELQRQYYRRHDIPCLSLDGSFQVGMPSGQLITRVKAFVEMLS
ncbi:MAG: 2-hydroxyacyl-CoA dehydratase, partial [Oscillospiraceae bacterium]|nr:2-hydroxyacyl-CoA dehydratase [Oscillospiraceae bacterium]